MDRRRYLAGLCTLSSLGAGCLTSDSSGRGGTPETGTTAEGPPNWTRSTDCDGMDDSVVKVKWTVSDLDDGYAPIQYEDLSPEEQSLARRIVRNGGVGVCERSDAFDRFISSVRRAVDTQREHGDDYSMAYLAYEGRYYGLYVEVTDMVISYG